MFHFIILYLHTQWVACPQTEGGVQVAGAGLLGLPVQRPGAATLGPHPRLRLPGDSPWYIFTILTETLANHRHMPPICDTRHTCLLSVFSCM